MLIKNCFVEFYLEIIEWCYDLYENFEIMFEVYCIVVFVVEWLMVFGCDEVVIGLGCIGVVGVIKGWLDMCGVVIGLWVDMDVLLILEEIGLDYVLKIEGVMYVCGYDGYMLMFLGVVKYLVEM